LLARRHRHPFGRLSAAGGGRWDPHWVLSGETSCAYRAAADGTRHGWHGEVADGVRTYEPGDLGRIAVPGGQVSRVDVDA
jgi:hypothetical protein